MQEIELIDRMIDRIGTRGGALVVRGEPGIGKSALLEVAAGRAREQGATVVTATGTQSEARLAFGALHQLLLPFVHRLAHLPDPQRKALDIAFGVVEGDAPDPFLVGLATLGVLTESAAKAPLLVVVDDAQWLDRPSAEVLEFVARRLDMEVVVLLLAVREGVPSPFDAAGLRELPLAGLHEAASRTLLEVNGAGLDEELQERILSEAAGNPLALIELPTMSAGLEPAIIWQPLTLTARLEAAFTARLKPLDGNAHALLLLAALDDAEVDRLSHAAEDLLDTRVYLSDWTRAATSGLGTLQAGRFRFRHPLMRSAVHQSATDEQRRRAHAALARVIAGGPDPDRAVWHQAAAAEESDEVVAGALIGAADRAESRGGHDVAFAALQRAAGLTADPQQRALLLQRAGEMAMEQGHSNESIAILREALRLGLPAAAAARASFTLETMMSAWSGASAIPRFAEMAKEVAAHGDDLAALDRFAPVGMRAHWGPMETTTRSEVSEIVAGLSVPGDEPMRLSALALIDPVHRGREVIDRLTRMSPVGMADPVDLMHLGMAAAAVWADNLALPFLRSAVASFRADGRLQLLGQCLVIEAWADVRRGAVRTAITGAAEGARVVAETGALRYVPMANLAHAVAAAELGEDQTAEHLIAEAEAALLPMGVNPLLAVVALARGRTALAGERPSEAYADLVRIFTPTNAAYQPFVRGWALADLVEAAVHGGGDIELVRGVLREWREIATDTRATYLEGQLAYATALLADDATAEKCFRAATTSRADGSPFLVARAQLAYGQWLRRQRRDMDARVPLREATQVFDALGQRRQADRSLRELRATGERARRRVPEAWTQLSPQELQIAQLAAEGLSNREIGQRLYLSHRTIGTHLYNLFPKLGITSRAQLRDALRTPDGS